MTGAFDNLKLCSYLFAADTFDDGNKIFESFRPIIESVLVQVGKPNISFLALQEKIDEIYNTTIPKATLKTLLDSLRTEGKIKLEKNHIYINGEMLNSQYFDERDKKEHELNDLFLGYREFLLIREVKITSDEAKQSICKYIFTHCYDLADFIKRSIKPEQTEDENSNHISYLCEFLFYCKINNTALYSAFLRLYKGAVQSTLLNFNPEKIKSLQNLNLNIKKVILDTNFLMRILDIQTELEGQMAQETIRLLKAQNVELVVLPQTLDEIRVSIKTFLAESEPYSQDAKVYYKHQQIRMSGLLSALQRGKSRTFLLELSKHSILKKQLEIELEICVLNEDDKRSECLEDEIQSLIATKAKDGYGLKQATHDLSLISYCRRNRNKHIDVFTEAECWVLTNDIKLTYWNQKNCDGIQECITESQLSNLLWLQTPKEDNAGLSNTMITLANRELINSSKFFNFIDKMHVYRETIINSPAAIDNLSLIFACDCLATVDIQRITDNDSGISDVISEKAEVIRQVNEDKDLVLSQNFDENAKLKLELKISGLVVRRQDVLKKIEDNKYNQEHKDTEIHKLQEERESTFKIEKLRINAGRGLAIIITGIIILMIVTFKLLLVNKPMISTIFNRIDVLNFPEWIKSVLLTIVITLVISVILFLLTAYITGTPMNPKELFNYFKEKLLRRLINYRNMPIELQSVNIAMKKESIEISITELKEQVCTLKEQKQDLIYILERVDRELVGLGYEK